MTTGNHGGGVAMETEPEGLDLHTYSHTSPEWSEQWEILDQQSGNHNNPPDLIQTQNQCTSTGNPVPQLSIWIVFSRYPVRTFPANVQIFVSCWMMAGTSYKVPQNHWRMTLE